MSAAPEKTGLRIPGLDGLRGLACLMVFVYHLRWHAQPSTENPLRLEVFGFNLERWFARFDAGVAIFFVLSGLLLSLPFWRAILSNAGAPDTLRYYWRRICRIVPAYYAVLIVVYLLRPGTYTFYGGVDFLLHATFLHTFSDSSYYGVYPLLWTIGIEFQFYLLLPAIMAVLAWGYHRGGAVLAVSILFVGTWLLDWAARESLSRLAPVIQDRFLADQQSAVVGGTIFSYLKLFAFGIVGALAFLRWKPKAAVADVTAGVSFVAFLALLANGDEGVWRDVSLYGWPLNAFVLAIFAVSVARSRFFARAFSSRAAAGLGTISYGVYLWHELIQRAVFGGTLPNLLQGGMLFVTGGCVALAITILIAALSWRFVERPALNSPFPFARA